MTNGDPKFAYQTTSKWVWNLFNLCKWMFNFFKLCKWTVDLCFCFAAAVVAIPCVVLLVVLCVALYQSVRSLMCLVTYASLGAFDVILGATIKAVCFIWTPITTSPLGASMPSFSSAAIVTFFGNYSTSPVQS